MKRNLRSIFTGLILLITANSVSAQNVYFREGFNEGENDLPNSAAASVPGRYITSVNSGTWYTYGAYRTNGPTGSCATQTGGLTHIRFANLSSITSAADSAYIITPVLDFGVNQVSFFNGRASRRINIFKTTDTLATTTNWTFVAVSTTTNLACDQITFTVNDPTAKRIRLMARGGTDSDIDSIVVTSTSTIVPVKFAGISASYANNLVKLNWRIAAEVNTTNYVVERSNNGTEFTTLGSVDANNAGSYNWIDNSPVKGTGFYRIKAVDKDGSFMYSSTVQVNVNSKASEVVVTPNPVKGGLVKIQLNNAERGSYNVVVYNNNGQVVFNTTLQNDGSFTSRSIQLPAGISAGMYRMQLTNGSTNLTKSIVVE